MHDTHNHKYIRSTSIETYIEPLSVFLPPTTEACTNGSTSCIIMLKFVIIVVEIYVGYMNTLQYYKGWLNLACRMT